MNLTDKICLITGATSGIGKETAIALAKMGATIVFTSRDQQKGELVKNEIIKLSNNDKVDVLECNLSSFESIKNFSNNFKEKYKHLHILINNAGIWETKFTLSKDGIESNFAVNHIAPFLLTNLLLDIIKNSQPARIINVASSLHERATMNFDDLEGEKNFNNRQAYGQSKLANVLFTKQLAVDLKDSGVTVNCLMPGVVQTNLFQKANVVIRLLVRAVWISPQKGAETSVYLASSPDVENVTGEYFEKKKIKRSSKESNNMNIAKRLAEVSKKYVKDYLQQ